MGFCVGFLSLGYCFFLLVSFGSVGFEVSWREGDISGIFFIDFYFRCGMGCCGFGGWSEGVLGFIFVKFLVLRVALFTLFSCWC